MKSAFIFSMSMLRPGESLGGLSSDTMESRFGIGHHQTLELSAEFELSSHGAADVPIQESMPPIALVGARILSQHSVLRIQVALPPLGLRTDRWMCPAALSHQ